jgi:hypothetical protein
MFCPVFGTMDLCLCYDSANGIAATLALMTSLTPVWMSRPITTALTQAWVLVPKIIESQGDVEMEHLSSVYQLLDLYIVTKAAVIIRCCQV